MRKRENELAKQKAIQDATAAKEKGTLKMQTLPEGSEIEKGAALREAQI